MQRTTIPGGLDNTSRVMNPASFNLLSKQDQSTATRHSGAWATRFIGRCRGTQDTRARAGMQVAGIETTEADASFFTDFQARVSPLEPAWAQEAQAKGLKNAVPVLQAFRDEVRQPR